MMNTANPTVSPVRRRPTGARRRPSTLPQRRSKLSMTLFTVAGLVAMTVCIVKRKKGKTLTDACLLSTIPFSVLFVKESFMRLGYFFEELQHLNARYDNSFSTLCKDVFHFSSSSWCIAICSSIINLIKHNKFPVLAWLDLGPVSMLSSLLGAFFLNKTYMQLENGPLYDRLWIGDSHGLDFPSGMAHSFFFGYLKLIIPKSRSEDKNLEELMKDYEAENGIQFACYKLFILIPKSAFCPPSLKDGNASQSIEESRSLDPKTKTVAGVRNRIYKNSVYKIKNNDGSWTYVCAEYATPLKTFHDAMEYRGEYSDYYNKYKNEIVLQFCFALKKILRQHKDCRDYCEAIFYDDEKNGSWNEEVVKQVLVNRVKKVGRDTNRVVERQ